VYGYLLYKFTILDYLLGLDYIYPYNKFYFLRTSGVFTTTFQYESMFVFPFECVEQNISTLQDKNVEGKKCLDGYSDAAEKQTQT